MRKKPGEAVDPVSVRLDPDQLIALDKLARDERTSRAAIFRKLVDEGLRARAAEGKPPATPVRSQAPIAPPPLPPAVYDGLLDVAHRISEMAERYGGPPQKERKPRAASR
jgi:hypothetical protein